MLRGAPGLSLAGLSLSLTLACNGGIGVTDASSYGTTTQNQSSDPTSNSASASEPTSGGPAGTSTGGSGGLASSGSDSSGDPVTSGPTSGSTTSPTSGPTTGTGESTGGPASCLDVSLNDHGDCDLFLGYAFDGTSCRAFSGCDCGPDCDSFFASAVDCASSCAANGGCNDAAIEAAFLAMDPVQVGSHCDQVDACAVPNTDAANWLAELFPGLTCEGSGPCELGQPCTLQFAGTLDEAQWQKLCAASLLPNAELYCVVFGP